MDALLRASKDDPVDFVRRRSTEASAHMNDLQAFTRVAEGCGIDSSAFVRRSAASALETTRMGAATEAPRDYNLRRSTSAASIPSGATLHQSCRDAHFRFLLQFPLRAQVSGTEIAMRQVEDGNVGPVLEQSFLDPREDRRMAAAETLRSMAQKPKHDLAGDRDRLKKELPMRIRADAPNGTNATFLRNRIRLKGS